MASIRRYAVLYRSEDGDRAEWASAGIGLAAEEAVERFYKAHPNGEIIKPIRGSFPDDLDLSPPEGVTDGEGEGGGENEFAWSEDMWLDENYQTRKATVVAGDVDDHLDAIEDCETSSTVEEAVEARRAELEGEA